MLHQLFSPLLGDGVIREEGVGVRADLPQCGHVGDIDNVQFDIEPNGAARGV